MLFKLFIFSGLLFANAAGACAVGSAQITGRINGSDIRNGQCLVTVLVETSKPHRVCPLRLMPEQEIVVATRLTKKQCPLDEGGVKGVVSSGGVIPYHFRGVIDGHKTK